MESTRANCRNLMQIITHLETVKQVFDGLACGLDCAMDDEEREIYAGAEGLLGTCIIKLKVLTGCPLNIINGLNPLSENNANSEFKPE